MSFVIENCFVKQFPGLLQPTHPTYLHNCFHHLSIGHSARNTFIRQAYKLIDQDWTLPYYLTTINQYQRRKIKLLAHQRVPSDTTNNGTKTTASSMNVVLPDIGKTSLEIQHLSPTPFNQQANSLHPALPQGQTPNTQPGSYTITCKCSEV